MSPPRKSSSGESALDPIAASEQEPNVGFGCWSAVAESWCEEVQHDLLPHYPKLTLCWASNSVTSNSGICLATN